jgi:hypothetical protein
VMRYNDLFANRCDDRNDIPMLLSPTWYAD